MCMSFQLILLLAYTAFMTVLFAGTYLLGDLSWIATLLAILSNLLLWTRLGPALRPWRWRPTRRGVVRCLRIGAALVALVVPAAWLCKALGAGEPVRILATIAVVLLVSLVDREYFGWMAGDDGPARAS